MYTQWTPLMIHHVHYQITTYLGRYVCRGFQHHICASHILLCQKLIHRACNAKHCLAKRSALPRRDRPKLTFRDLQNFHARHWGGTPPLESAPTCLNVIKERYQTFHQSYVSGGCVEQMLCREKLITLPTGKTTATKGSTPKRHQDPVSGPFKDPGNSGALGWFYREILSDVCLKAQTSITDVFGIGV